MTLLDVLRLADSYRKLPKPARQAVEQFATGEVPNATQDGFMKQAQGWLAEARGFDVDDSHEALTLADSVLGAEESGEIQELRIGLGLGDAEEDDYSEDSRP